MTRQKELASLIERGLQTEHVAEWEGGDHRDYAALSG